MDGLLLDLHLLLLILIMDFIMATLHYSHLHLILLINGVHHDFPSSQFREMENVQQTTWIASLSLVIHVWLVVEPPTPLKNDGLRQLG